MTHRNIQYFCTAERCILRVWTSPKAGRFCSRIKCPHLEVLIKKNTENNTVSIQKVTDSEIALMAAMKSCGISANEAVKAFEQLSKALKKNDGDAL